MVKKLQIVAFTHKQTEIEKIGFLHLSEESQSEILPVIKDKFGFNEFMFLSTCNRVELIFNTAKNIDALLLSQVLLEINPTLTLGDVSVLAENASFFKGIEAVEHMYHVASSLDSLVIGEREIITQVRKSYETCYKMGITGDLIRLVIKQTIETAKDVYTRTGIAKNPVSVVSLAYRELRDLNIKNDARILIVGAGETNTNLAKYLQKHKFANFVVFNRTESKAQKLATELKGKAFQLNELGKYKEGFDVLITCTSSETPIITKDIYTSLLNGERGKKVIIDLAVPNDIDRNLVHEFDIKLIAVESLKEQAQQNMVKRGHELEACQKIIEMHIGEFKSIVKERNVELAFGEIPRKVKEIKELALNEVFAKDINGLDTQSKEVLDKVLAYMEKKYNAVAMKTAKEALLKS
ncbi:MAG: glutamyl-tRNA reductase [Bacteroidota bacterium]|nr:glutamyl-tRNA reductase [Bacteroidota bacterium]